MPNNKLDKDQTEQNKDVKVEITTETMPDQSSPIFKNLVAFFNAVTTGNETKALHISEWLEMQLSLDGDSNENLATQKEHELNHHPIQPKRGEVYTAEMGSNVGSEFQDLHLVLILQNNKGNLYSNTTIVLPITDHRGRYDKSIHHAIYNSDFESTVRHGLDKSPSRIKLADISTIDKARLKTKVGKVAPKFLGIIEGKLKNLIFKN